MIIKNLTRRSGSGQLLKYVLRYALREDKRLPIPKHLGPLAKEAAKYKTAPSFEKAAREAGLLVYHGTPVPFSGVPNTESRTYGNFGNGFYLAHTRSVAAKYAPETGQVKKYLIDPNARLFDAGKRHAAFLKLYASMSRDGRSMVPLHEAHDRIRAYLIQEGYAGIRGTKETVIFKADAVMELPADFYIQAKSLATAGKTKEKIPEQTPFLIRHNVRSHTLSGYTREFERNEEHRLSKRKDAVAVHHTILSFSNLDTKHVTDAVLTDMAKKYIELRGTDNLYVITAHRDRQHIHLHCVMSGTRLDGRSSRISRAAFADLKRTLDAYQQEKYPELAHSLPRHGRGKEERAKGAVEENIKRSERTSVRNDVLACLESAHQTANSRDVFLAAVSMAGYEPYYRANVLTGIRSSSGLAFRLDRLGYDAEKLGALDRREREEQELKSIGELRKGRSKSRVVRSEPSKKADTSKEAQQLHELVSLRDGGREGRKVDSPTTHEEEDMEREPDTETDRSNDEDKQPERSERGDDDRVAK